MTIYVTPYNIPTKECRAVSGVFPGADTVGRAAALLSPAGSRIISRSPRLVLIDLDSVSGLAISDIPYVRY